MIIQEEVVKLKTAELANLKGFSEICRSFYLPDYSKTDVFEDGYLHTNERYRKSKQKDRVTAPTQALLQTWLRMKHKLVIVIDYDYASGEMYCVTVGKTGPCIIDKCEHGFKTYEEALEAGLLYALNLIK